MTQFALQGELSRELLTYEGKILVHDNDRELEFLISGARAVVLPRDISEDQTMSIRFHPELSLIQWPLVREDFVI